MSHQPPPPSLDGLFWTASVCRRKGERLLSRSQRLNSNFTEEKKAKGEKRLGDGVCLTWRNQTSTLPLPFTPPFALDVGRRKGGLIKRDSIDRKGGFCYARSLQKKEGEKRGKEKKGMSISPMFFHCSALGSFLGNILNSGRRGNLLLLRSKDFSFFSFLSLFCYFSLVGEGGG